MDFSVIPRNLPYLLQGFGLTVVLALASMSASVYFPEPAGPARTTACGKRSRASISRRRWTTSELPWKSVNKAVSFQPNAWQLAVGIWPGIFLSLAESR